MKLVLATATTMDVLDPKDISGRHSIRRLRSDFDHDRMLAAIPQSRLTLVFNCDQILTPADVDKIVRRVTGS